MPWGEGSPRKVAFDLIDAALKDMLRNGLYGHVTENYQAVFNAVADIKEELGERCDKETRTANFDWSQVAEGAMFYHARYKIRGHDPEHCRIAHITYDGDDILNVFYEVGANRALVYNPRDEFPAVVLRWG